MGSLGWVPRSRIGTDRLRLFECPVLSPETDGGRARLVVFSFLRRRRIAAAILAGSVFGLFGGCEKRGIEAYRAPKQQTPAATPETPGAAPARAPAEAQVVWTAPQGWVSVPSDQPMRLATFQPGAGLPEVTLNAFPGDTGGLLANVNRWRGQLGLPAIEESQLAQAAPTEIVEGVSVTTVDFTGANGQEMLGAILSPGDGKTWFVKSTGEPAAIATLKPSFAEFARSFRLQGGVIPPDHPQITPPAPDKGSVQARLTAWTLPPHWHVDPNASAIVAAGYEATNADGGAKITATMLMSDGGGPLANINRWRGQLGLPAVERLDQQPTTDLGGGSLLVDLSSGDGARRMMAAIVSSRDQTWFFKITGTPKGVEAERPDFERLVRVVGLGEGAP